MAEPDNTQPAPQVDTHEIATRALESLTDASEAASSPGASEATEAPSLGSPAVSDGGSAASGTASGQAAPAPTAKAVSDAEQLLHDAGYVSVRKPDGREHWIPRSKVVAMIESGLKSKSSAHEKARTDLETALRAAQQQAQQAQQWREAMAGEPRALLERMAQVDPRYQVYLQQGNARPASALPREEDDPEPEPDIDLGNGRSTYSLKGLRDRDAWVQRKMERAVEERMRPFQELKARAEEREARRRADDAVHERSAASLLRARQWPKWAEYEPAILKALQDDSAESERTGQPMKLQNVYDAYMAVAGPALLTDEKAMREKILRELNAAPRSTSLPQTGAEPTRAAAGRTTEEIARRAMARLEGRAG